MRFVFVAARAAALITAASAFGCPKKDVEVVRVYPRGCRPVPAGDTLSMLAAAGRDDGIGRLYSSDERPSAFRWSASPQSVATVSSIGVLRAHSPGTVTVTATAEGVSGSVDVPVIGAVGPLVLEPAEVTARIGDTIQISATLNDLNGAPVTGVEMFISINGYRSAEILELIDAFRLVARDTGMVILSACAALRQDSVSVTVIPAPRTPASAGWRPQR